MLRAFGLLAGLKRLRGTRLDPFGCTADRRQERRLIGDYEALIEEVLHGLRADNHATAVELASLPDRIRGFGPVKERFMEHAKRREARAARGVPRRRQGTAQAARAGTPKGHDRGMSLGRRRTRIVLFSLPLLGGCGIGAVEPGTVAQDAIPDPTQLERVGEPREWLVCPPDACRAVADAPSRSFAVDPPTLMAVWKEVIVETPRTTIIAEDPTRLLVMAQTRSRLLGFVDTITLRLLPQPGGQTSYAADSRAELGYYDFGVNRRRLERWAAAVEEAVGAGDIR